MTVNWTESALADLRGIESYLARHSPQYAIGIVDKVFDRTEVLQDHPQLGAVVPEYDDESLRELFEDPYRIVYRVVDDERIDVVAVVHSARRVPRGL